MSCKLCVGPKKKGTFDLSLTLIRTASVDFKQVSVLEVLMTWWCLVSF